MKIYAVREVWQYETYDLIEFFLLKEDAIRRADELNKVKPEYHDDYEVEEVIVK